MADMNNWISKELLDAFYRVISDYRLGLIEEEIMKERLFQIAERYERTIGLAQNEQQKGLF